MTAAQKFYEKNGFVRTHEQIVQTDHFACEVKYIKGL
jgi:putative acetyltransferase